MSNSQISSNTPSGSLITVIRGFASPHPRRELTRLLEAYNRRQRELLQKRLSELEPYQFEHLIRQLLEAMGYEDVVVTKESGDKGVDVIGTVQFGITTVTEVVQVKRH